VTGQPMLFSQRQTAEALAVSEKTVRRLVARGELAVIRVGRRVLITRDELARFIREGEARR